MNDEIKSGLIGLAVFACIAIPVFGGLGLSWHLQIENIDKLQEELNCDELHIEFNKVKDVKANSGSYRYASELSHAIYQECIKPNFPDSGYSYPVDSELVNFFGSQTCKDLREHITKKYYDYEMAIEVSNLKCEDKIEIEIIEQEYVVPETPETWTKSDESSYGAQYEK